MRGNNNLKTGAVSLIAGPLALEVLTLHELLLDKKSCQPAASSATHELRCLLQIRWMDGCCRWTRPPRESRPPPDAEILGHAHSRAIDSAFYSGPSAQSSSETLFKLIFCYGRADDDYSIEPMRHRRRCRRHQHRCLSSQNSQLSKNCVSHSCRQYSFKHTMFWLGKRSRRQPISIPESGSRFRRSPGKGPYLLNQSLLCILGLLSAAIRPGLAKNFCER